MPAFYTDEDVAVTLVNLLRAVGYVSTSTRDEGMLDADDGPQLEYATTHKWTIIMHNTKDFRRLHAQWITEGRRHFGILTLDRPRGQTPEAIVQRLADLLSRPDLVLENAFWRWRVNNQWRHYPDDKG